MAKLKKLYFLLVVVGLFFGSDKAFTSSSPVPAVGKVTLIELGSEWCMPCKLMRPILEKVQRTYPKDLKVIIVDVSKDKQAANMYGIRVIPTQIFFDRDGKEYKRHTGYLPEKEIVKILEELKVKE